ncbi:cnl2 nkp2 family protein [Phlyctema vagabunda]|uniref:Cnl2 nkp2 family protein n=1 Tax=Phlyctema vagabunda TaxID=108571 RepID=A0ABR4PUY7_9HELO
MAPTEETILSTFLLPPAPLPAIISLKAFSEYFPKAQQSSPVVRVLYRDLQHQRARLVDAVTRDIVTEAKRGNVQRRAVIQTRRAAERTELDDEVEVEQALFGQTSNLPFFKPHTLKSILPDLESAVEDVEDEVRRLEEEAEALLLEMKSTIGNLSDLRYGRLANGKLREQVLEGLQSLESACDKT